MVLHVRLSSACCSVNGNISLIMTKVMVRVGVRKLALWYACATQNLLGLSVSMQPQVSTCSRGLSLPWWWGGYLDFQDTKAFFSTPARPDQLPPLLCGTWKKRRGCPWCRFQGIHAVTGAVSQERANLPSQHASAAASDSLECVTLIEEKRSGRAHSPT